MENKIQQKIYAIWQKAKRHISSFVGGQFRKKINGYLLFLLEFKIGWVILVSMICKDIVVSESINIMVLNIISDIIAFIVITFLIYVFRDWLIRIFYKTKHSIYQYPEIITKQILFDEKVFKECILEIKFISDVKYSMFRYENLVTHCNFYNQNDELIGKDSLDIIFSDETKKRFPIIKGEFEQNEPLKFFIRRGDLYRLSQEKADKYKLHLQFVGTKPKRDYHSEIDITEIIENFNDTAIFPINTTINLVSHTEQWLKESHNKKKIRDRIKNETPELLKREDDSEPSKYDIDPNEKIESRTIAISKNPQDLIDIYYGKKDGKDE